MYFDIKYRSNFNSLRTYLYILLKNADILITIQFTTINNVITLSLNLSYFHSNWHYQQKLWTVPIFNNSERVINIPYNLHFDAYKLPA